MHRTRLERYGALTLGGAAAFLVPWIAHLDRTLPERTTAENWRLAWVGLDGAIAAGLVGTVALARRHDRRVAPVGTATAALMLADSWFDVCTSSPAGRPWAIASACCEVPLAVLCVVYAMRHERAETTASDDARGDRGPEAVTALRARPEPVSGAPRREAAVGSAVPFARTSTGASEES